MIQKIIKHFFSEHILFVKSAKFKDFIKFATFFYGTHYLKL